MEKERKILRTFAVQKSLPVRKWLFRKITR